MKNLVLLFCFFLVKGLNAQLPNDYFYYISVKFDQGGFTYSEENSIMTVVNNSAEVRLLFKMTDTKTASTNFAHVEGIGYGAANEDEFSVTGNGTLITYERGKEDSRLPFSFSISGEFSSKTEESILLGNFTMNDGNGEQTGRVSGKGKIWTRFKLNLVMGSFKILKYKDQATEVYGGADKWMNTADKSSSKWITGTSIMGIQPGDKIETGENTRLNLTFPDGSTFFIKSNSTVRLAEPDLIEVLVGKLYFKLQKQGKEFQVVTPSDVIGDLGTEFIVTVDSEGNTEVDLLSGKVYVKDNMEKNLTLEAGEHISVSKSGGLGTVSKINPEEVKNEFDATDNSALNQKENVPQENSVSIAGKYNMVANSYKGMLEFSGDMRSGKIYFDIGNKWEEITNLTYNSSTGELSFTRPWAGNPNFQKYTGRISSNKITGVFTDVNYGSQEFPWEAVKNSP